MLHICSQIDWVYEITSLLCKFRLLLDGNLSRKWVIPHISAPEGLLPWHQCMHILPKANLWLCASMAQGPSVRPTNGALLRWKTLHVIKLHFIAATFCICDRDLAFGIVKISLLVFFSLVCFMPTMKICCYLYKLFAFEPKLPSDVGLF